METLRLKNGVADATGKAVVVISSTVTPSSVGTKFRSVAVPVVTWESGLFANMGMTGTSGLSWFADCPTAFSWTDGTPTLSVTSTTTGINTNGSVGNGFEITVPADTNLKTLKLYVGVWYAQGKLEATLSDGSAPAFVDTAMNKNNGASSGLYTINYKAAASGQNLKIRFTILTQYFSPNGNVAWEAATLQ